jgi:transcriptional regulator with XRE-family HTH domain
MEGASVAKVVGANARALRVAAKVTAERFAAAAGSVGLPWTTGRVGDFEHGRIPADLSTIYAAAVALGDVIGRPVTLPELLVTDEPVTINDTLTIAPTALLGEIVPVAGQLSGKGELSGVVAPAVPGPFRGKGELSGRRAPVLETDYRMCRNIKVDRETGVAAMAALWGHPFSAERDHRAGPDANQQRRGIVARQLKAELKEALGIDGDD